MSEVRYQRWLFEHTHMKVSWIKYSIKQKDEILTYPPPVYPLPSSPYGTSIAFHKQPPASPSSSPKINPAVLFIIVILAVLFFISGLLHLLVRFLTKHQSSTSSQSDRVEVSSRSDALERQLQQLFHLHDSGLDQAFIDALPVFMYKEVVGSKEPFDCAVCLCEFTDKDKLRLLPTCSHAFHISCIDTWLLSNSTCPLCRGTLFSPGFSVENPMFDFDDPNDDECHGNRRYALSSNQKTVEIEEIAVESGVLPVRLGKFRKLDGSDSAGGETSSSNLDARRCYSMGSYQYVVADTSLEVALNNVRDGSDAKLVKSKECSHSSFPDGDNNGKKISIGTKTDSYSVSKIWQWSKKGQFSGSSNTQLDYPSSLDHELPWMRKTEGRPIMDQFYNKYSPSSSTTFEKINTLWTRIKKFSPSPGIGHPYMWAGSKNFSSSTGIGHPYLWASIKNSSPNSGIWHPCGSLTSLIHHLYEIEEYLFTS